MKRPSVSMYGYYYEISDIMNDHVNVKAYLNDLAFKGTVLGRDVNDFS